MPTPNPPAKDYLFNQIADLQTRVKNLEQQPKSQAQYAFVLSSTYTPSSTNASLTNASQWGNGTTAGPAVTVNIGPSGLAAVTISAFVQPGNYSLGETAGVGVLITNPARTIPPYSNSFIQSQAPASSGLGYQASITFLAGSYAAVAMSPGSTTFQVQFAGTTSGVTATFSLITLVVTPL